MNRLRKYFAEARTRRRALAVSGLVVAIGLGVSAVDTIAQREDAARKVPVALQFERAADQWLSNPEPASALRQAMDEQRLAAVGIAATPPGLVLYTLADGRKASTILPGCSSTGCTGSVLDRLADGSAASGFPLVRVEVDNRTHSRRALDAARAMLPSFALLGIIIAALLVSIRLQAGTGTASAGLATRPETGFDDAIGNHEAKAALRRVQAFLRDASRYAKLGASAPRGVLLVGPPGTGKTLLAKALAGESGAHFIAVDGSYFTAPFYGAGVQKVKALFRQARSHAPCVLFIDEVDGIGRRTRNGEGGPGSGAESELNRIINRILVEMDGFDALDNVVVVGATNHEENLDPAMRRPGRFDTVVRLTLPALPDRKALFDLYIGRTAHDGRADTAALARMTAGVSPADIANIVNKAAASAAEAGTDAVHEAHLLSAIESHHLGGEVSAHRGLLTEDTRQRLAYHEAGHALVGHCLGAGQVERVTIEPRGVALGVTHITRDSEDPIYDQAELGSRLAMMLGGREAELLVQGSVSSGASDDLKRASALAVDMVGTLGFSRTFGLLSVTGVPKDLLGPDVQAGLLTEARALLEEAQARCRAVLVERRDALDAVASALLQQEVLSGEDFRALLFQS
ncbi:MAG: AAA family ATPase [bacterium]|jgi:cell division protease FtsH|nr:AAA family ATPase [Betaproteobacteria bacterium]